LLVQGFNPEGVRKAIAQLSVIIQVTRRAPQLVAPNHESTTNAAQRRLDENFSSCLARLTLRNCRCVQLVEVPMDSEKGFKLSAGRALF
jgi:hypothetical protein